MTAMAENAEHSEFINGLEDKFTAADKAAHARIRNMLWVLYDQRRAIVSNFKEDFSDIEFSFKEKSHG